MKIGNKVKLKNVNGTVDENMWEIIGFYEACGRDFVKLRHPTIGGTFSFPKNIVLEVVCE